METKWGEGDCKECERTFDKQYAWSIYCSEICRYQCGYKRRKKKGRLADTVRKFGLTAEQYLIKFKNQKEVCAICGNTQKSKNLAVDHDHQTGEVRELLCQRCNFLLGHAKDSIWVLSEAILYLHKHGVKRDTCREVFKKRMGRN